MSEIKLLAATAATPADYNLAEGVLWDDRANLIRWVDIWKGRVLSGELDSGRITNIHEVSIGETAGAVALAEDGGLLVAAARGLATVSPTGDRSLGPDLLGERTDVRFNDGTVDPHGAFVVGTLSLTERTDEEVLLRVWPDGRVDTLRDGIGLSNGVAFSPDGATIYHVDTFAGTVSRHSYSPAPFNPEEPWVIVLDGLPAYPDGLTVDAEGALWVAQWGGASVRRHAPTGELLAVVEVDAAQASCPGFIGQNLTTLAVATAQEGLDTLTDQAGAIFLADVGVSGLPPHRWAGSTTIPYWRKETT
ncbi:SMP-30/gluconolactonase/LRE family protein (plasmid) [Arthrobacter sp. G.S.26]|uniref:SMP-30/gluconolactonase/LRE family protein n=1 Tax=Arthrobacter sp. G.S.26 TaxID=3433706 RepID=UPI003D76D042